MADIRTVTSDFAVAPQLAPEDMAEAASRGFKFIINNRPDGEAANQPSAANMEQAALAAGLGYVYIPVSGGPGPDQVQAVREALRRADGPVLAFCRSGTRSIITWSLGRAQGGTSRQDLIDLAAEAGYDLSAILN